MARKASLSNTAKPHGVQRKAQLKAAKEKKQRKATASPPRSSTSNRPSRGRLSLTEQTEDGDDTVPDLEDIQEETPIAEENRPFVYLKARTRKFPSDKITSEWRGLNAASQDKIQEIITVARRSIVHVSRNKKRVQQGDEAVEQLEKKLLRALPQMPFPPKTKEESFDYEKLLEQSVSLVPVC
jgi:hypothetical protein